MFIDFNYKSRKYKDNLNPYIYREYHNRSVEPQAGWFSAFASMVCI